MMQFERRGDAMVKHWTNGVVFDAKAREQVFRAAALPYIFKHVAIMPDVHYGIGATVGSVIPTRGAIIPAAVGVDIGCGMFAQRLPSITSQHLGDNAEEFRAAIEAAVPVGNSSHSEVPDKAARSWARLMARTRKYPLENSILNAKQSPVQQIGTLGGGNHFIELCLDENDRVWLMLHSGSRGFGNRIGRHFIDIAKRECEKWGVKLPDADLSYLPEDTDHFEQYIEAMLLAQDYAAENRRVMVDLVTQALTVSGLPIGNVQGAETAINCHHNYASREHHFGSDIWVTRKGAVRARAGDLGIIPGSMGARSYIVRGKGNPESFMSCSHGAGRVMSRGEANKTITLEQHIEATKGVACRKDAGVLDESPAAYKSIDAVMAAQSDLVEIVHTLRAVVCVKG